MLSFSGSLPQRASANVGGVRKNMTFGKMGQGLTRPCSWARLGSVPLRLLYHRCPAHLRFAEVDVLTDLCPLRCPVGRTSRSQHVAPRDTMDRPLLQSTYLSSVPAPFLSKKTLNFPSSHSKSALLSPGPPAQWPQTVGNISSWPTPGFVFATSYRESSGLHVWSTSISPESQA